MALAGRRRTRISLPVAVVRVSLQEPDQVHLPCRAGVDHCKCREDPRVVRLSHPEPHQLEEAWVDDLALVPKAAAVRDVDRLSHGRPPIWRDPKVVTRPERPGLD